MINALKLIVSIIVCQLTGLVAYFFTRPAIPGWYAGLHKPAFNPPAWIFGPVWTIIYLFMGIAAYAVWKQGLSNWQVKHALFIFTVQLVLNFAWSILFFGLHSIVAGLVDIVLLWLAIIFTFSAFYKLSKTAGVLIAPYLVWVTFAMILNFSLWLLN